ncbi:MAG TPA: HD domain-containing phosphohydrolase [Patescibacteria group bacterium]|nr:HD domain-containing phosphohydrolase [Patescibacteria group bacterium]
MHPDRTILVINDDIVIARYLQKELSARGGYQVLCASTGQEGFAFFSKGRVDVAIVRLGLPDMNTAGIFRLLRSVDQDCVIIGFIDELSPHTVEDISGLGFYEFVTKPIDLEKLFFVVKKAAELHALLLGHRKLTGGLQEQNGFLQKQNVLLARRVEDSTKNLCRLYEDLRSTYMRTIKAFAQTIDARDHYTHSHSQNVAYYAVEIAEQMHLLPKDIETIREACELHDLGKIGVQDCILTKPAALTPEEWVEVKRHPQIAAQILESLPLLSGVVDMVKQHHERYDGLGYPAGLAGQDILLGARIIHLADAYEAMRTPRSYRQQPFLKDAAVNEIRKNTGTQFDPQVVDEFLKIVDKLEKT